MTFLDPAHWSPSQRALGAFVAVAAGTAAGVATGGVAGAGAMALAGLFGNVLAGDLAKLWEERRNDPRYGHPNHDLTKLVGDAIAQVLYDSAKESGLKKHAAWLKSLAKIAAESYGNVEAHEVFAQIASDQLPDLFRRAATSDCGEFPLLTEEAWTGFVEFLSDKAGRKSDPQAVPIVASRLHRRLFGAVREIFKRDFAGDGRAYAALCLDMNAVILARITSVYESQQSLQTELKALRVDLRSRHERYWVRLSSEQAAELSWLAAEVRTIGERLDNLLDVAVETKQTASKILAGQASLATKDDLKAIEERILRHLADKVPGQDPREREFPPELIEQAKLLLARGNKEQQAAAEIALRNHVRADALIQELKQEPLSEAFRLLTLEGDNWYEAGEFDRAIGPYEQALALRPNDFSADSNFNLAHARLFVQLRDSKKRLAESCVVFGDKYKDFCSLGKAVEFYEMAIDIFTKEAHPVDWAMTQNKLGNAWAVMPTGDRGQNLGNAIVAYEAALTVYTKEAHPVDWAMTQYNLAMALADLANVLPEKRCSLLKRAIACGTGALTVRTAGSFPRDHAATLKNLKINRAAYEAAGCDAEMPCDAIEPAT